MQKSNSHMEVYYTTVRMLVHSKVLSQESSRNPKQKSLGLVESLETPDEENVKGSSTRNEPERLKMQHALGFYILPRVHLKLENETDRMSRHHGAGPLRSTGGSRDEDETEQFRRSDGAGRTLRCGTDSRGGHSVRRFVEVFLSTPLAPRTEQSEESPQCQDETDNKSQTLLTKYIEEIAGRQITSSRSGHGQ